MKKGFLILLILVIIQLTSAQVMDELRVRYKSPAKNLTIDLSKYLGSGPYYHSKTEDVNVVILNGTAFLSAPTGWLGVEEILFTTNKSKVIKEGVEIKIKPTRVIPLREFKQINISDTDLSGTFNEETKHIFDFIRDNLEIQEIDYVDVEIKNQNLLININDLVNFNIGFEERSEKPIVITDIILTNKQTELDKEALKFKLNNNIIYTAIIILLIILFFIFKSKIKIKKIKNKKEKVTILSRLNNLKYQTDKEETKIKFIELLDEFLNDYFEINLNSSFLELNNILKKKKISGVAKQEIIYLFEHRPKTGKELELMIDYFENILSKLK